MTSPLQQTALPATGQPESNAPSGTSLFSLALLGIDLRWRLSTNRLRRRGKRTRRLVIAAAVAYTIANFVGLGLARYMADERAATTVVLLMCSMAFGWAFGPVLIGGVDETVDPTRLALLPLTPIERHVIQLSAALSSTGSVAATVGLIGGLVFGHIGWGISLVIVPLAAVSAVLLMVGSARCLAAALAIAQRSRTGRDAAVLLAALVGGALFTMAQLARNVARLGDSYLLGAMSWLPWAWPARAINASRAGHEAEAGVWLLLTIAVMVGSQLLWVRLSNHLLLNGERSARARHRGDRAVLNGASTEFGAVLSRQWVYLRRSPNSRVGFVFGMVFGVVFSIVQITQQGQGVNAAAAFGILLAMLANLGAATNVLGFDAGSLWMEVLAGGPTRANLIARQLIALPNLLLPTWLSGVIVAIWVGNARLVLLVALLAIPVAVNVLSFGLITSVVMPAPLPDFDNPFGNRQGNESRTSRIVAIALAGIVAIVVLSAPIFIVMFRALGTWWLWTTPLIGLAYATALFMSVATWAGWYLSGREPVLIERLAPRALN